MYNKRFRSAYVVAYVGLAAVLVVWFGLVLTLAGEVQAAPPKTWQAVRSMTPTPSKTRTPTVTPTLSATEEQRIDERVTATPDCLLLVCTRGYPPDVAAVCPPPPPVQIELLCYPLTRQPR